MTLISPLDAFEHVRDHIESETGRECFLVQVPREDMAARMPFSILYPIGLMIRKEDAPLEPIPNPFSFQCQVTSVGRDSTDAEWMISQAGEALETMAPLPGMSGVDVRLNLGYREGPSEGVVSGIGRWSVKFA